jgi:predicted nucleotidyltransferase
MNPVEHTLREVVDLVDHLRIPYAVMGGLAVRAHGIPRPTYDVDITVIASRGDILLILNELRQLGYHVAEEFDKGWVDSVSGMPLVKITRFVEGRSLAVDIFLAETPFQHSLMSRKIRDRINGYEAWLVTPEDLILLKLLAGRPRDSADVVDILTMQLRYDVDYMRHWADVLGIRTKLNEMLTKYP